MVAEVDGAPLWFGSEDTPLRPSPEAYGSALYLAALLQGRGLRMSDPVDRTWLTGVSSVPATVGQWWDVPSIRPAAKVVRRGPVEQQRSARGLCFTCGIDSFHALEQTDLAPDLLVFAGGYDVALDEVARLDDLTGRVREVAASRDIDAIIVSTNLRTHPSFSPVNWEQTHGGALAALGHLVADRIGLIAIASSFTREHARPWGSRWDLDPRWSSAAVEVRHIGDDRRREDKIADLGPESSAWRHLQVCWEHRTPTGNCGRCDKCVVTAVGLAAYGRRVDGLPRGEDLRAAIDSLPSTAYLNSYRRMLVERRIPAELHDAASSLLDRATDG